MLTGSYFNTVDDKSRIAIPAKLRYELGERVWLVKGIDTCLYVFTQDGWADFKDEYITNLKMTDTNARRLQRFILGGSREFEIDKQGRINLPQDHKDYAGIEKDVVFLGCGNRIELWPLDAYEKEIDPANLNPDELMSSVASAAAGE
jgi:MraZ protein